MQSLLFWGLKAQISGLNYFSFFVSIAGMLTRTQASRPRTGPRTRPSRPRPGPRTQGSRPRTGPRTDGSRPRPGPRT